MTDTVNPSAPVACPLPSEGYLRLRNIIGDRSAKPHPIPAIIPVSKSTWWARVASGEYPKPVKLGARVSVWRVEDIRRLIAEPGK